MVEFDVFLCHNSQDKPEVRNIAHQLQQLGLNPWLDEWHLQPGLPWQRELERQIRNIKSAAVFVGKSGLGPWQEMEIEAYLRRFVRQGSPVIPVLLPNAPEQPELPIFLEGMTWVDFRSSEPIDRLIWGITGKRPDYQTPVTHPSRKPPPESKPEIELKSAKGVDYTKLRDLLAAGQWKEADRETADRMVEVANREEEGWLAIEDIDNFPCEDLRTINQLWVHHSLGRFGFSVQKDIYLDLGGNYVAWSEFVSGVGWCSAPGWMYTMKDLNRIAEGKNGKIPPGHFPVRWFMGATGVDREYYFRDGYYIAGRSVSVNRDWKGLLSRILTCRL